MRHIMKPSSYGNLYRFIMLASAIVLSTVSLSFLSGCSSNQNVISSTPKSLVVKTIAPCGTGDSNGDSITSNGNTIAIPTTFKQSQVHRSTRYPDFNWVDPCKSVFDKWQEEKKVDDHCCMIGDRYLVAVTTKFGQVGDYIDVTFSDGSIMKAQIADSKGDVASGGDVYPDQAVWGGVQYNTGSDDYDGVDVIEFETDNGCNIGESAHMEWKQSVKSITCYGSNEDAASSGSAKKSAQSTTTSVNSSAYSKEKDGYKIPMGLDGSGNPVSTDDSQRGIGIFVQEEHMPNALADPSKHDMTHDGHGDMSDAGSTAGSSGSGPWGNYQDPLDEVYYICMRWEYASVSWGGGTTTTNGDSSVMASSINGTDSEQFAWTGKQKVMVYNKETGRYCICAVIEYGPGVANRIGGLSPEAMSYLTDGKGGDGGWPELESLGWMNNENATPGPCLSNQDQSSSCSSSSDSSSNVGVDGALKWAIKAALSKTVGYAQDTRNTVQDFDGKTAVNADCSSLVYWSLVKGGGFDNISKASPGTAFTAGSDGSGSESGVLTSCGWEKHVFTGNVNDLKKGDILESPVHTAWYCGNGMICEASEDENGGYTGGKPGDQKQQEDSPSEDSVGEVQYHKASSLNNFTYYYRYKGTGSSTS